MRVRRMIDSVELAQIEIEYALADLNACLSEKYTKAGDMGGQMSSKESTAFSAIMSVSDALKALQDSLGKLDKLV